MKYSSTSMFWNPDDIARLPFEMSQIREMRTLYPAAMKYVLSRLKNVYVNDPAKNAHHSLQHISSRLKSIDSIIGKLRRNHLPIDYDTMKKKIHDIAGVRVVCSYVTDVYDLAYRLASMDDLVVVKVKDYIVNPKKSGYRSLHLIVSVPVFVSGQKHMVPVEVQLRTIAMDFWASLEHQLRYKSEQAVSHSVAYQLASLAGRIYEADLEMQQIYHAVTS